MWLNNCLYSARSFCPEHSWTQSKYLNHGKKSIFNATSESDSESAGDDNDSDDNNADFIVASSSSSAIPRNLIAEEKISGTGSGIVEKIQDCCTQQCEPCYVEECIGASESNKDDTDICRIPRNLVPEKEISKTGSSSRGKIDEEESIAGSQCEKHDFSPNESCLEDIAVARDFYRNNSEYDVSQVTQNSGISTQHPDKACSREQSDDMLESDLFGYDFPFCNCVDDCLCACHDCCSTRKEESKDVAKECSNWQDQRLNAEVFDTLAVTCAPGDVKKKEDLRSNQRGTERSSNGKYDLAV